MTNDVLKQVIWKKLISQCSVYLISDQYKVKICKYRNFKKLKKVLKLKIA